MMICCSQDKSPSSSGFRGCSGKGCAHGRGWKSHKAWASILFGLWMDNMYCYDILDLTRIFD